MARKLHIATGSSRFDARWEGREVTWSEYLELIRFNNPADVKDCGGIFGGELLNGQRTGPSVISRSIVMLDADRSDNRLIYDLHDKLGAWAWAWHTTWSHTPELPKHRIHLPLNRDVSGEEYELITLALIFTLGKDRFDLTCVERSRMMYLASTQNGHYKHNTSDSRKPIDADEWLAIAQESVWVQARLAERHAGVTELEPVGDERPSDQRLDKAQAILNKAAREVETLTDEKTGQPFAGRNDALIRRLPVLYRLALGGCLVREIVDDVMWTAACAAPGKDQWTRLEHQQVSASAVAYAEADGGGWPSIDPDEFDAVEPEEGELFSYSPSKWLRGSQLLTDQLAQYVTSVMPMGRDALSGRLLCFTEGVWQSAELPFRYAMTRILGDFWTPARNREQEEFLLSSGKTPLIYRNAVVPHLINCKSGMLDWKTGEMLAYDAAYLSTVQLPWHYDPAAKCPQFLRFLSQVLDEDAVEHMQEVIGYLTYSGNPLHQVILFWGPLGRNGKSTLVTLLKALIGDTNYSSWSLQDLSGGDKFASSDLYGMTANVAADIRAGWLADTSFLKNLTGGDAVTAQHKNQHAFKFVPWFVPVFAANELPKANDSSAAFFDRWNVIKFPHTFRDHPDIHLTERLLTELPGIFAWAVEGLKRLMERGRFDPPPSVREAQAVLTQTGDNVRAFLADYCEAGGKELEANRKMVWEAYRESGGKLTRNSFMARMRQIPGISEHKDGNGNWVYRGIRLKDYDEREFED